MTLEKHRGKVIEVYPTEARAAVSFKWRGRERVETVPLYVGVEATKLEVGQTGWMTYNITPSCGLWGFSPFKTEQPIASNG